MVGSLNNNPFEFVGCLMSEGIKGKKKKKLYPPPTSEIENDPPHGRS